MSRLGTRVTLDVTKYDSGRVIRELDIPRTELVITTKIFFGFKTGPNDTGLSRKQYVLHLVLLDSCLTIIV